MIRFWTYWNASQEAKKNIPELRKMVWKAVMLNLAIMFVLAGSMAWVLYAFVLDPLSASIVEIAPGWLAFLGKVLLWLVYATLLIVMGFFSMKISLALMELWHEVVVAKVINHFRPLKDQKLTLKGVGIMTGTALWEVFKAIAVGLLILLLGFVPVVGSILAFMVGAFFLGRSIHAPYRVVLKEHKLGISLPSPTWLFNLQYGTLHLFLAMIPVIGWVLAPYSLLNHILGTAWQMESQDRA